jgi:DNA-binding transcriptional ArsR family regulator
VRGGRHIARDRVERRFRETLRRPAGVAVTAALSLDGWEAVRAEALRRITRRVWAPGDLIPGEAALAEEFGVSRATVSRALRALAEDGLLDRRARPARGSRRRPRAAPRWKSR